MVQVEGLDAAGIARYQGSTGTMTLQEGQTIKAPTVQLALKSASVAVDWTLPGGGKCSTAMVDSVTAQLFDTSGNWQSLEINVDCDSTFADPDIEPLSGRELDILKLIAGGYSNKEIAETVFLAEGTVKNHVSNILSKLNTRDRTRAVLKALSAKLI